MNQLPHSNELEQSLLGVILLDGDKCYDLAINLDISIGSFYLSPHQSIFRAMQSLNAKGKGIDLRTVANELGVQLEHVGGDSYLELCLDTGVTAAHTEHYASEVRNYEIRRQAIVVAYDVIQQAERGGDAETIRAGAEFKFSEIKSMRSEELTPAEILDEQIELWKKAQTTKCVGLSTGFDFLDTYLGGLLECSHIIIAGEPGMGKTTLARNIAENIAGDQGIPVAFESLEQTYAQIWGAIAARRAKTSLFWFNSGSSKADFEAMARAKAEVQDWPIHVQDRPHTIEQCRSWTKNMVEQRGCKVVIIDYIQRLGMKGKMSQEERISRVSMNVTSMAKDFRVPVISLASLSREGNLRGSGQLDFDAWAILKLTKAESWTPENQIVNVAFLKQRFGPQCRPIELKLLGGESRFDEFWQLDQTNKGGTCQQKMQLKPKS